MSDRRQLPSVRVLLLLLHDGAARCHAGRGSCPSPCLHVTLTALDAGVTLRSLLRSPATRRRRFAMTSSVETTTATSSAPPAMPTGTATAAMFLPDCCVGREAASVWLSRASLSLGTAGLLLSASIRGQQ